MQTLREKREQLSRFLPGAGLASVRGDRSEPSAVSARNFANRLIASLPSTGSPAAL